MCRSLAIHFILQSKSHSKRLKKSTQCHLCLGSSHKTARLILDPHEQSMLWAAPLQVGCLIHSVWSSAWLIQTGPPLLLWLGRVSCLLNMEAKRMNIDCLHLLLVNQADTHQLWSYRRVHCLYLWNTGWGGARKTPMQTLSGLGLHSFPVRCWELTYLLGLRWIPFHQKQSKK